MRSFLVGLILLTCCAGSAFGQASGFVEKIGFGKRFRPQGWTPILVNLTSQIGEPAEYQIQVRQEDLDRDRVVFRRDIVLNPNKQEQFWVYFMAQPRGLPEGSAIELDKALDVRLCTRAGKPLLKLGIQDPLTSLEPPRGGFGVIRGRKLVLMVTDGTGGGSSMPAVSDFNGAIGINEDVEVVLCTAFDLPENVIGYDAVDAIVWLDADAGKLTSGGSRRMAAVTDFVRAGGRLVVCQPVDKFKIEAFADVLPVGVKSAAGDWLIDVRDKWDLEPIRTLSAFRTTDLSGEAEKLRLDQRNGWNQIQQKAPFKVAFARLRDDAVGEEWINWKGDASEMSPWIARRPLGLGSVTWVAQDLGNPVLTGRFSSGWPYVWDKVFGQRNIDMRSPDETEGNLPYAEKARNAYYAATAVDLGASFLRGMEHEGRAGGLVFLAGVFFVGYWIIAGPVSYLVLAGKKRTDLSWTIFAVSALAATLLTVGVVRLVLRGDAEVHHVSLVRMLPAGRSEDGTKPVSRAVVNSRIGLYIPRDYSSPGEGAPVTLLENDPQALSYITPFSVHPAHMGGTTDFPAYLEYEIPVRDAPLNEPVSVKIPYRSTLKKLQARWVGHLGGGIDVDTRGGLEQNRPQLVPGERTIEVTDGSGAKVRVPNGIVNGRLVNRSGTDLSHVYLAFHYPVIYEGGPEFDYVLYLPVWPDGAAVDLGREFNGAARVPLPGSAGNLPNQAVPGGGNKRAIAGNIRDNWAPHWYNGLRPSGLGDQLDDSRNEFLRAFPMLSLFERVQPQRNTTGSTDRVEILRRAARDWDMSEVVLAGQLVIIGQGGKPGATSDNPLPFPMEVEGDRVTGSGTTFYQFALPLGRGQLTPPWTRTGDDESAPAPAPPAVGDPPPAAAAPTVEP